MKKILLLIIGLTIISCGSDDENIIESNCPCEFTGETTELFPATSVSSPEYNGFGTKRIGLSLDYPCQEYIGRNYKINPKITIIYSMIDKDDTVEVVTLQDAYSFTMNQEWINTINSNGSIDGFNITIRDCLESNSESN